MTRRPRIVQRSYFWRPARIVFAGVLLGVVAACLSVAMKSLWPTMGGAILAMSVLSRRFGENEPMHVSETSFIYGMIVFDAGYILPSTVIIGIDFLGLADGLAFAIPMCVVLALPSLLTLVMPAVIVGTAVHHVWPVCLEIAACRSCEYSLTGNTSGICPECGNSIP
jgi:predicted RNA-binding Zn-ribbon protein involved in translation (DUF1610 family)